MSIYVAPPATHPHTTPHPISAPSAPGVHDTLRANLGLALPPPASSSSSTPAAAAAATTTATTGTAPNTAAVPLQSTHPLEARLRAWDANADNTRMQMWRHANGVALPVWKGVHMQAVRVGEWRPAALGGSSGVLSDVLSGRDGEVGWEDVFGAGQEFREVPDFHTEMEARVRMNAL